MATIQSVPKSKMTNSEFINFCLLIINHISESNFSVLKFKSVYNLFLEGYKNFDNSLNKISKTAYWARVRVLKSKINESRSGLYNLVLAESKSQDSEIREAAKTLLDMLKPYNKMTRMRYNDFLRYLDKLINLCESDKYKALITKVGLEKRIEGLRKLHNDALDLEKMLIDDEGLNKRKRKPAITRYELEVNYDKMVKRLNALAEIDGDSEYLELFAWWNALIDRYRVIISQRLGANKVGKPDEGESSQHDPSTGPDQNEGGGGSGGGGEDDRPVIE